MFCGDGDTNGVAGLVDDHARDRRPKPFLLEVFGQRVGRCSVTVNPDTENSPFGLAAHRMNGTCIPRSAQASNISVKCSVS
jgi:hypothetical protein